MIIGGSVVGSVANCNIEIEHVWTRNEEEGASNREVQLRRFTNRNSVLL